MVFEIYGEFKREFEIFGEFEREVGKDAGTILELTCYVFLFT